MISSGWGPRFAELRVSFSAGLFALVNSWTSGCDSGSALIFCGTERTGLTGAAAGVSSSTNSGKVTSRSTAPANGTCGSASSEMVVGVMLDRRVARIVRVLGLLTFETGFVARMGFAGLLLTIFRGETFLFAAPVLRAWVATLWRLRETVRTAGFTALLERGFFVFMPQTIPLRRAPGTFRYETRLRCRAGRRKFKLERLPTHLGFQDAIFAVNFGGDGRNNCGAICSLNRK